MKRPAEGDPEEADAAGAESGDSSGGEEEDEAGGVPRAGEEASAAAGGAAQAAAASGFGAGRRKKSQVVLSDGRVVSVKVRNHVNPLLPHFQKPVPIPAGGDWGKVFRDPSKPIVLDIGAAKGRFCLEGARRFPDFNWLGIEIREPLVVRANEWSKEENLGNLHYIFGNASAGVADLLASMPAGVLRRVTIQCPDPCFKKKHQKRRMVTNRLVEELAEHMPSGAVLFVQSDVAQVAMQMADTIAAVAPGAFARVERLPAEGGEAPSAEPAIEPVRRVRATTGRDYQDKDVGGGEWEHKGAGCTEGSYNWLPDNPLGLMSERESSTISRGLPMFRALFQRAERQAAAPAAEATGAKEEATKAPECS